MRPVLILAAVLSFIGAGCRDSVQPDPIVAIVIFPSSAQLYVGDVVQLRATGRTASGDTLIQPRVLWSSLNPAVAAVDSTGRVAMLSPGNAKITATAGKLQGVAELGVYYRAGFCDSVILSPASVTLHVGDTLRASAKGCGETAADFRWSSNAPGIVAVSDSAVLTALAVGRAAIFARARIDTTLFGAIAATVVP